MPFTEEQRARAKRAQARAAEDERPQVRLIAGPGTGKSYTIEDRVCWLLENETDPKCVFAISFTNAAAADLRHRIIQSCTNQGHDGSSVSVTTLHSLALRMLRKAGLLERFPVSPVVTDRWELDNVFTPEYRHVSGKGKKRAEHIRRDREAYWSTGRFDPPNYIPPDPPISGAERRSLQAFLPRFEQVYSCILPGEIVRECVDQINAGILTPL
jgi:hypothetical protein